LRKGLMRYVISGIALVFLFTGCSKAPTQEMNSAKASIDALMTEGADKCAPDARCLPISQVVRDRIMYED
jgi:hypothetical protein